VIRVTVPRNGDDITCVRLLEQLHALVESNPGQHLVQLILRDRAGNSIELIDAAILIDYSPQVDAQLRALVGDGQVAMLPSGQPSDAPAF
jgi:hypothetical protein